MIFERAKKRFFHRELKKHGKRIFVEIYKMRFFG